jgi:hypothetical protein
MIGLGTWEFSVDTMVFKGNALLTVGQQNGAYDISVDVRDMQTPEILISDVEENGNTLSGIATSPLLKGKEIPFSMTFEGDTANGSLRVPFLGRIKLNQGRKVA